MGLRGEYFYVYNIIWFRNTLRRCILCLRSPREIRTGITVLYLNVHLVCSWVPPYVRAVNARFVDAKQIKVLCVLFRRRGVHVANVSAVSSSVFSLENAPNQLGPRRSISFAAWNTHRGSALLFCFKRVSSLFPQYCCLYVQRTFCRCETNKSTVHVVSSSGRLRCERVVGYFRWKTLQTSWARVGGTSERVRFPRVRYIKCSVCVWN